MPGWKGVTQQAHAKPLRMHGRLGWRRCRRDDAAGVTATDEIRGVACSPIASTCRKLKDMEHWTQGVKKKKLNSALAVKTGKRKGIGDEQKRKPLTLWIEGEIYLSISTCVLRK